MRRVVNGLLVAAVAALSLSAGHLLAADQPSASAVAPANITPVRAPAFPIRRSFRRYSYQPPVMRSPSYSTRPSSTAGNGKGGMNWRADRKVMGL